MFNASFFPRTRCVAAGVTLMLASVLSARAFAAEEPLDASLNERVISVPSASGPSLMLQVTVFTPAGPGPFPLAVLNHGKEFGRADSQARYRSEFLSRYFLSRGYAVALPMMRGFAGSQGRFEFPRCSAEASGLMQAQDIEAVVDFMAHESYVDGQQVVVSGQSFGGWNTLAFGTLHDGRVKGLLDFAGGVLDPGCDAWQRRLIEAAGDYGAKARTPSLWFYGENDGKFPISLSRGMYERYTAAGGSAEFVNVGSFVEDSHNLLGNLEGLAIWVPKVDAFLTRVGLPGTVLHAEYLPATYPPPSHFAALDDVGAVPYLDSEAGLQSYRDFLKKPLPRVFVVSPTAITKFSGGFDPLARALLECGKRSPYCRPYAIDNDVVWTRPTPAPPPTNFAALDDEAALPFVNDGGRQAYERFLKMRKPRAFVIAPDGAWSASALGNDPLAAAMASCEKQHVGCRFFAVDDLVVWQ